MGKLLKTYLMPHPPIMIREVGRGNEREIEATINAAVKVGEEIKSLKPGTVVILVPPHGPSFSDAVSINYDSSIKGNLGGFGAPEVRFEYIMNTKLVDIILKKSGENKIPIEPIDKSGSKRYRIPNELDHGSMVPLYFINEKYKDFKLVHITYGLLSHEELYKFGRVVRESIEAGEEDAVFIASGDLSHRLTYDAPAGFSPQGEKFDKTIVDYLREPEAEKIMDMDRELVEAAGECGFRSILVMLGLLDGLQVQGRLLSYEGTFGVGYCVAGYDIKGVSQEGSKVDLFYNRRRNEIAQIRKDEDIYVKLARESAEHYIRTGRKLPLPDGLSEEMLGKKAGVFVSIKKNGQLRGCIGTIEGVNDNIAEEIIENAISASTRDPRFYPIDEDELSSLVYSVDILNDAEPIEYTEELDPKKYGVIVQKGGRSGLLLPNLEGVDTVEEQLRIVLQKAGIKKHEAYSMERFEVIRHR